MQIISVENNTNDMFISTQYKFNCLAYYLIIPVNPSPYNFIRRTLYIYSIFIFFFLPSFCFVSFFSFPFDIFIGKSSTQSSNYRYNICCHLLYLLLSATCFHALVLLQVSTVYCFYVNNTNFKLNFIKLVSENQ